MRLCLICDVATAAENNAAKQINDIKYNSFFIVTFLFMLHKPGYRLDT